MNTSWLSAALPVLLVLAGCAGPSEEEPVDGFLVGVMEYEGPYGEPAEVRFNDETGTSVAVIGYPGFVTLFVDPETTPEDVTAVAEANDASVVAQFPAIGLYELQGVVGYEAALVAVLQDQPFTSSAYPSLALEESAASSADEKLIEIYRGEEEVLLFDGYKKPLSACPWVSHGGHAETVVETPVDGEADGTPSVQAQGYERPKTARALVHHLGLAAKAAEKDDTVRVISLSLGAAGNPNQTYPRGCTEPRCKEMMIRQYNFLESIYRGIQLLPPETRKHIVITLSSGNKGLDLTTEADFIRQVFPDAHKQILLVGGVDDESMPIADFNSAGGGPDAMVYARAKDVARDTPAQFVLPGTTPDGLCAPDGTSFASPQYARLLAQLLKSVPGLTAQQAVQAIRNSCTVIEADPPNASVVPTWCTLPTLQEAEEQARALAAEDVTNESTWEDDAETYPTYATETEPPPDPTASLTSLTCTYVSKVREPQGGYPENDHMIVTWSVSASGMATGGSEWATLYVSADLRVNFPEYATVPRLTTAWADDSANPDPSESDPTWKIGWTEGDPIETTWSFSGLMASTWYYAYHETSNDYDTERLTLTVSAQGGYPSITQDVTCSPPP